MATEIFSIHKICANDVHSILQLGVSDFGCSLRLLTGQTVSRQIFVTTTENNLFNTL